MFAELVAALGVSGLTAEVILAAPMASIGATPESLTTEQVLQLGPKIVAIIGSSGLFTEEQRAVAGERAEQLLRDAAAR